jgi:hypothetical protein
MFLGLWASFLFAVVRDYRFRRSVGGVVIVMWDTRA